VILQNDTNNRLFKTSKKGSLYLGNLQHDVSLDAKEKRKKGWGAIN